MFLSECREFPSAPCLAGRKKLDESSRLDVAEIARVAWHPCELVSFLAGLKTYQQVLFSVIDTTLILFLFLSTPFEPSTI